MPEKPPQVTPSLKVGELFVHLKTLLELERVPGTEGLNRVVTGADVSSPSRPSASRCSGKPR
jgi:hypothetical protein